MQRRFYVFCLFFALFHWLHAVPAAAQRLPDTIVPEHYTLWFAPDLDKATFRGRETIRVQIKAPARTIVLHAAEIDFGDVTISAGNGMQAATVTLDANTETATLTVAQEIPAGNATLQITYTGMLNDKLRGFYLSRANGRKYAVTQMEATDARRAFPSFDEPAYKATFDVSLTIDRQDTAISNGAQRSDVPGPEPGKHTVTFARTPKMSTYLVAMLVGDFACRSGSADKTPVRVCSTPDKVALLAKLEDEGLVRRASHERDGRRVDVLLTARGRALAEAAFAALLEAQSGLLAPFGGRRRSELLLALDALLEVFAGVRPQRAARALAPMRGTRAAAGRRGRARPPA